MSLVINFLYALPSFLSGSARVLDLGGTFDEYNDSPNGQVADARAIYSDWLAVGVALSSCMNQLSVPRQPRTTPTDQTVVEQAQQT